MRKQNNYRKKCILLNLYMADYFAVAKYVQHTGVNRRSHYDCCSAVARQTLEPKQKSIEMLIPQRLVQKREERRGDTTSQTAGWATGDHWQLEDYAKVHVCLACTADDDRFTRLRGSVLANSCIACWSEDCINSGTPRWSLHTMPKVSARGTARKTSYVSFTWRYYTRKTVFYSRHIKYIIRIVVPNLTISWRAMHYWIKRRKQMSISIKAS